jgi:hypothetical protein
MKKYQVFCRADRKGAKWREYSGIFDTTEEAADRLLRAMNFDRGNPVIYKVKTVEAENASRSAECINFTDVQTKVYEQVKAAKKTGNTENLHDIRDKYGYDLYKWALDELNRQEEKTIYILWSAACSGEIDILKAYYENGGKVGREYFKFGISHSLIAGALRNRNYETVDYLLSVGETVSGESEQREMTAYYNQKLIDAAENLTDYFSCHNKNLTGKQYELFDELKEIIKKLK